MIEICDQIIKISFYLLFALVPLFLTPWNYEIFEFNKMLLTYFLTVLIVAAWLIKMLRLRRIIFRATLLDWPLFLFLISQIISFIFSIDRHTSLFGYYSRFNGGLLSIICYLLLYWALVANLNRRAGRVAVHCSLISAVLVCSYGIAQHFGIDDQYWVQDVKNRVFSTLGQPNWLAGYLIALTPLAWAGALRPKSKAKISPYPILHALFAMLYFICLLYTKSRSGILGFCFSFFVFWLLVFLKEKKKILKPLILFTICYLLLAILIGTAWTPNLAQLGKKFLAGKGATVSRQIIAPEPGGTESGEIRKIVWQGAWEIFKHHPLFGTGPETFAYSYYWYRPRQHNDTSEWDFLYNRAHNEYLNYLSTTGILGLGSYLLFIGFFVGWNVKNLKFEFCPPAGGLRLALLSGWLGLLVVHFFGFSVVMTNLFLFLFPGLAIVLSDEEKPAKKLKVKFQPAFRDYLFLLMILELASYFIFSICRMWWADFVFARARKEARSGSLNEAVIYFEKAARLNPEPLFDNELANTASLRAVELYQEKETTTAGQLARLAVEKSDQAIKISPYHLQYWKTRTKIFYNLSEIDQGFTQAALETLLEAVKLAPTDAKLFYNLGFLYYYLGEKDKAIEILQKTLELKPDYAEVKEKLKDWSEKE